MSEKMGWEFVNMDSEIEKTEGKTIAEISENGKNWNRFRTAELEMLKGLLKKDNIIISAGGGVGVNDILFDDKKTFGEVGAEILKKDKNTIKVLFTASEESIEYWLRQSETEKRGERPILDSKMAESLEEHSLNKIIEHNLEVFRSRKSSYKNLADLIIDTSKDPNLDKILEVINARNK